MDLDLKRKFILTLIYKNENSNYQHQLLIMPKIATIIFVFLYSGFCLSQTKELYIFYDDKSELSLYESSNDTLQIKGYRFNLSIPTTYLTLSIKNDSIVKEINLPSGKGRSISFNYINLNNDNDLFLINNKKVKNKLLYHEMKAVKDLNNLYEFISYFKNVYLINEEDFFDGFYIAHKVSLRPLDARL